MEKNLIVTHQNNAIRRWPEHQSAVFTLLAVFLAGLLAYPFPVFIVQGQYPFHLLYFFWSIAILVVPVAIGSKEYHTFLTVLVWGLRWLMGVEFLIVSLQTQSVEIRDIISWIGVLAPTFCYEIGCITVAYRRYWMLLKIFLTVYLLTVLPVSIAAIIAFVHGGAQGLLDSVNILRHLHPSWPNYVAVTIAICILIVKELVAIQRRYWFFLMLFLLIIGLTLSRTGIVALLCGLLFESLDRSEKIDSFHYRIRSRRKSFRSGFLLVLVVLIVAWLIFNNKEITFGSTVYYTISGRITRWSQAIQVWDDNPLFGVGFRSFTKAVPYYEHYNNIRNMGSSHNDFIDLLVRGGVIYLLMFLFFVTIYLIHSLRKGSNKVLGIEKITLSIPITILSAAIVQNPLKDPLIVSLFWLFIGMGTACNRRNVR